VRLDSGDLLELSRATRGALDEAGMKETRIAASGDLEEGRIADLVAAGAPIDLWGVGTDLGTSRDSPVVNGVYKLVADLDEDGAWRAVAKHSTDKATIGGAKQVFRSYDGETMAGDLIAGVGEACDGDALLVPVMRNGEITHTESLEQVRERAATQLAALPEPLRSQRDDEVEPYPVRWSERLSVRLERD
jgi:nicotinate phosphoribosyltransferase